MMSSQHDVRYWDPFHQKNGNKIGDSKTRGWVISRGLAILQTWRDLDTANLLAAGTRVQTSLIKLCVTGYHNLGNATKAAHIEREGHMVNNKGKLFVTGYHNLDNSDRAANKAAHIEREGHMVNDKRKLCVAGYHNLGGLGGAVSTTALIKRDCYMINDKGVRTSTAHNRLGKIGAEARDKIARATVLSEHHSHICISALCQSGASVKWEGQNVRLFHLCYDPEQSGLAGQKPRQVKGLGLHVCKKCHKTARKCKETSCLAPATHNNNSLMLCKHLH